MILSLKILLAAVFVVTGGAVFTSWGRRHPFLVGLAALVSIVGTYYLGRSIYNDFKRDISHDLAQPVNRSAQDGWNQSSIWAPPSNIDTYRLCDDQANQQSSLECLTSSMSENGAPREAVQFTQELNEHGIPSSYMHGFRELGAIDVALIVDPFAMSEGGEYVFVNGRPQIMNAIDLIGYSTLQRESSRHLANLNAANPRIWSIRQIVGSIEKDRFQLVTLRWDIRECRACEVLGTIDAEYEFSLASGTYRGFRFHNLQPA